MKRRMPSLKREGYIRGQVPALPFLIFLLVLGSLGSLLSFNTVFFSGGQLTKVAAINQQLINTIDGGGEVTIPRNIYVYINSCPNFLIETQEPKEIYVGDQLMISKNDIPRMRKKCNVMGAIVCTGARSPPSLLSSTRGFVRTCAYSLRIPSIEEDIKIPARGKLAAIAVETEGKRGAKIEVRYE